MTGRTRRHLAEALSGFAMAALLVACNGQSSQERMKIVDSIARICHDGDIVLRRGNSMESDIVATADRHGYYTHCGILAHIGDSMLVVHAVPNEPDFEGDPDRVKAEPLQEFFDVRKASGGCLLRCLADSATAVGSARKAVEIYRRHTLFDHEFDISDTTEMYCSELVEYAYRQNGVFISDGLHHNYNMPSLRLRNVIFPSDFLRSSKTKVLVSF